MVDWIKLYHRIPAQFLSVPASMRGYYLRWWRYGSETEQLIYEALERDTWSTERWKAWQEDRLAFILRRAATQVPYYRQQWAARRQQGDRASWEVLENWPVLKKLPLRETPRAFLAEGCDPRRMFAEHTSGSTGTPLTLWQSRAMLHAYYALYEARIRRWNGLTRHDRWGILGGQLVRPFNAVQPPFWVWNAAFSQLYLSSYHLTPAAIPAYLDAIRRYRLRYLLGYASSLTTLAEAAVASGLDFPDLQVVISNAEPLFPFQSQVIEAAFGCPVRNTYGMSETVAHASECPAGGTHLWPEVGMIEILADQEDQLLPAGSIGRLVCTGLINSDMPLIRYEVGDRGSMAARQCTCGNTLPLIGEIEGRMDDVLIMPDGRRIGRLDPIFKVDMPILEAQIIQEKPDVIRVKYVPAAGFHHSNALMQRIRERVGNITILMEQVEQIPRGPNGKFKAVIREF